MSKYKKQRRGGEYGKDNITAHEFAAKHSDVCLGLLPPNVEAEKPKKFVEVLQIQYTFLIDENVKEAILHEQCPALKHYV